MKEYENRHDEDIMRHFSYKDMNSFWKCWDKKMYKSKKSENNAVYVNGSNEPKVIANAFMNHFKSIYYNSYDNIEARQEFEECLQSAVCSDAQACNKYRCDISSITGELVEHCLKKLHSDKAAGPDGLMSEHLLFALPLVVVHLTNLFRCIAMRGYVPNEFGKGIIVPF